MPRIDRELLTLTIWSGPLPAGMGGANPATGSWPVLLSRTRIAVAMGSSPAEYVRRLRWLVERDRFLAPDALVDGHGAWHPPRVLAWLEASGKVGDQDEVLDVRSGRNRSYADPAEFPPVYEHAPVEYWSVAGASVYYGCARARIKTAMRRGRFVVPDALFGDPRVPVRLCRPAWDPDTIRAFPL